MVAGRWGGYGTVPIVSVELMRYAIVPQAWYTNRISGWILKGLSFPSAPIGSLGFSAWMFISYRGMLLLFNALNE